MPVGECRIAHDVDALRLPRIGDVEDDPITRASARRELAARENGDVVALVGAAGILRTLAMSAAAPQACEAARFGIGEYCGAIDDPRLRRVGDGDLDDVDADSAVRGSPATSPTQPCSSSPLRTPAVPET